MVCLPLLVCCCEAVAKELFMPRVCPRAEDGRGRPRAEVGLLRLSGLLRPSVSRESPKAALPATALPNALLRAPLVVNPSEPRVWPEPGAVKPPPARPPRPERPGPTLDAVVDGAANEVSAWRRLEGRDEELP